MTTRIGAALATVILFFATAAAAQEPPAGEAAALSPDAVFVFNTLLFLMGGFLVMFMAAGFCMLEVGLVRSKNAATICVKNIALYSIAGLMYWLIGYNLMYGITEGEYIARLALSDFAFAHPSAEEEAAASVSKGADWFFQMVFVATAASIVSGTLAERIKLWPFLIFVALLTGLI
ncbi:MAG: ammonium transporter, partial [Pseudomonadota bacterium]